MAVKRLIDECTSQLDDLRLHHTVGATSPDWAGACIPLAVAQLDLAAAPVDQAATMAAFVNPYEDPAAIDAAGEAPDLEFAGLFHDMATIPQDPSSLPLSSVAWLENSGALEAELYH